MKKLKFSIILLPFFVLSCTQVSPEEGSDNQIQAEISASPENIEYNPSDANANVIEVVSSVSWTAELSDSDLKISKLSGSSGTETIKIVSIPEGKTATVTFTTRKRSESDTQASARVTVTRKVASTSYSWVEMPQTVKSSADYKYVTHRGTTYSSKKSVRNYSACYDTKRHNPMWVAYPCHNIYWEGGYTRPDPDPWRPDPQFKQSEQSIIYATDWKNWPWEESENKPTDNYYYWTPLGVNDNNKSVTVGKGHLMRSAERGAKVPNVLFGLNEQTFYPTNISPERNRYAAHWSAVEYLLPNNWRCNDTVYVVAGCFYENEKTILYDASNWNKHSALSKPCVMPTAKYKVFLRTKSGITGKNIAECSADELMAIGFWFPQEHDPKVEVDEDKVTAPSLSTVIYSVADIERMIGGEFKFFPTAPEAVKKSYNIDDWPGLRAKL